MVNGKMNAKIKMVNKNRSPKNKSCHWSEAELGQNGAEQKYLEFPRKIFGLCDKEIEIDWTLDE